MSKFCRIPIKGKSLTATAVLSAVYVGLFLAVDSVVSTDVARVTAQPATGIVAVFAVGAFLTLFLLEAWLSQRTQPGWQAAPNWLRATYVHASNGFYVDAMVARVLHPLTS